MRLHTILSLLVRGSEIGGDSSCNGGEMHRVSLFQSKAMMVSVVLPAPPAAPLKINLYFHHYP